MVASILQKKLAPDVVDPLRDEALRVNKLAMAAEFIASGKSPQVIANSLRVVSELDEGLSIGTALDLIQRARSLEEGQQLATQLRDGVEVTFPDTPNLEDWRDVRPR